MDWAPTLTSPITGTSVPRYQNHPNAKYGHPGLGPFHHLPNIVAPDGDAREPMPAGTGVSHRRPSHNAAPVNAASKAVAPST